MMDRTVLFSVYDKKRGAIPLFYEGKNLTSEKATQIALRSQMTLAMMSSADLESAEAILPFSKLEKIAFILLFQISQADPNNPRCVASISYLVPQDQQVFLYNKVPFLKFKAEEIANQIKQQFVYTGNATLPPQLASLLSNWKITEKEAVAEIEIVERRVTISEKRDGSSIEFFLAQVKKNEDRAVGGLLRGEPIFVTGDSGAIVELIVHSLSLFAPHQALRKVGYSTQLIDPHQADIIGIPQGLVKHFPQEILVDTKKNLVRNGKSCPFSRKLIKQLRRNRNRQLEIVDAAINDILQVANQLTDAFSQSEEERDRSLQIIKETNDRDLVEIAAEISAQRNPLIRELVLKHLSAKFLDWMEGL
ncbi:MAG: hypothetical protein ACFFFG_07115 [Candidatus Thorarchaeota archaeon]